MGVYGPVYHVKVTRTSFLWRLSGCAEDGLEINDTLLNDLLTLASTAKEGVAVMKGVIRAGGLTIKQVSR